jgi:hypothetical protein
MSNVIILSSRDTGSVKQVSVHVGEYSQKNGGAGPGMPTLYGVDVLFTDGTWTNVGYYEDYGQACDAALKETKARGAVFLDQCFWPGREVIQ